MAKLKLKKIIIIACVAVFGFIIGYLIVSAQPSSISDTFADETYVGQGTEKVNIADDQVMLAECYIPDPDWYWSTTTVVRDISVIDDIHATTTKTIYCDNENCIFWEYGEPAPGTVCIATDPNVYGNILWANTDITTGTRTWGSSDFNTLETAISGLDIGGTHLAGTGAGSNNVLIDNRNWLENYYDSPEGAFPAMDRCKEIGSGWRLPNILELDSIRDMTVDSDPYSRLPDVASAYYWSSSEYSATRAYRLTFLNGLANSFDKPSGYRLRCVRGW